ncbi:ATP-binding protein, partial [Mesorhizobium waimense]|uniref:ATP-binding protein n=1 Tax=Mesorhizobium waimense TaxID=1300307 RepID=UPI001FDFB118
SDCCWARVRLGSPFSSYRGTTAAYAQGLQSGTWTRLPRLPHVITYKLRRSVIVTSNRVVQDWGTYLRDNTMSTTILDRLMHHCHLLEFDGRSYRLKEAAEALARETKSN